MTRRFSSSHPFGLTRTQAKIFDLLAKGSAVTPQAVLKDALGKRFASENLVATHVIRLRRKVEPHGFVITCGRGGKAYRMERVDA